jgi:hypothetical protein
MDRLEEGVDKVTSAAGGDRGRAALKAAGAAAVTGAATFAAWRAFAHESGGSSNGSEHNGHGESGSGGGSSSMLASAAATGWDAARDSILPLAEEAAGAAGKYVGEHAPDIVKERILPRFIESFNEAAG